MTGEQPLLTAKQAATLLCLSENTIRMWIWQRRLPVIRLGRAVRIDRGDLDDFIRHRRQAAIGGLSC